MGTTPTAALAYQQHLRLIRLYPSTPAPQFSLPPEPPYTTQSWAGCNAGDAWFVGIPSLHLSSKGGEGEDANMVYMFSRAFWGTWALRLEGAIVSVLGKIGVVQLFEGSGKIHSDEKGRFDKGATEVGDCVSCLSIILCSVRRLILISHFVSSSWRPICRLRLLQPPILFLAARYLSMGFPFPLREIPRGV